MMEKSLFDVPVYRISKEEYYSRRDASIEEAIQNAWSGLEPTEQQLKRNRDIREQHFYDRYGPWDFNEIVGYIRLYLLGTQIRGEYFSAEGVRVSLGRTRVFKYRTHKLAAETNLWGELDNEQLLAAVHDYLDRCAKELRNGRYIDRKTLENLGPYVDWNSLFGRK